MPRYFTLSLLVSVFAKPTALTLSDFTTSSTITITWIAPQTTTKPTNKTGYRVSWIPPDNDGIKDVTDGSTSTEITGLTSNTEYTITVAGIDIDGRIGEESDPLSETTSKRRFLIEHFLQIRNLTFANILRKALIQNAIVMFTIELPLQLTFVQVKFQNNFVSVSSAFLNVSRSSFSLEKFPT